MTKRNRATLRKVDPRSIPGYQYKNVYSAQEIPGLSQTPPVSREPLVRQGASQELGALGVGGLEELPIRPIHSPSRPVQSPSPVAQPSRPVTQPMRFVEGSVDGNVGLSEPVQASVVRPGAGTNGEGLELSQVNPVSGDNAGVSNGLRRSTRVVQRPDRYGIEYSNCLKQPSYCAVIGLQTV